MTPREMQLKLLTGKPVPFSEIPDEHRNFKVMSLWLKANLGSLKDIPPNLVDDELRLLAVGRVSQKSSSFDPAWESAQLILSQSEQAHLHHEVLMQLMENGRKYIKLIDQQLVTREFLLQALERNGDCLIPFLDGNGGVDGLGFPLDQEIIDAAVSNSTSLFDAFRPDQYSDEAVKTNLRNSSYSSYGFLNRIGKPHVLIDLMRDEGHWPSSEPKPKYLWDTVEKLMKCKGDKSMYHLYLRTFPMDDVVAEMKTPARRKELVSILTGDEAMHYLKTNTALKKDRHFKARLVEDGLGM